MIGMAAAARAALVLRASSRRCSNSSCSDIVPCLGSPIKLIVASEIKRNKLGLYLEKKILTKKKSMTMT